VTKPSNIDAVGSQWDQRFADHGWSAVPDESLVELSVDLAPGTALDLGAGTGRNALWLARTGWDVTAVDASQVGLTMALEQARREGIPLRTLRADLLDFVPDVGGFDLVVVANIHLAPNERDAFFARCADAVAPGGYLYVTGHHVDAFGLAGPPMRERLFDEDYFGTRFPGFTLEILERRETRADSGDTDDVSVLVWARRDEGDN